MTEEEFEQKALKVLKQATHEGRRTPRRHQMVALFVVFPLLSLLITLVILLSER